MPRQKSTHVDDPARVGKRLREARERAGLSQRALSFPGCTPAYISRIEAGQRIASLQLLTELGRRLGVSASYLATGREADSAESPAALVEAEVALRLDELDAAAALYERMLAESSLASVRSRSLEGLGRIALRNDDPERAVDLLRRALRETGEAETDRPSLAATLARAYGLLGRTGECVALLEACTRRHEGDPVLHVRLAGLLGAALADDGKTGQARRVLAGAVSRAREVAGPYARARLYWAESRRLAGKGRTDAAGAAARSALETLRVAEDTFAVARAHQLLAHVRLDQGEAREALDLLREGEPLAAGSATAAELARYRIEEARALAALGRTDEAAATAEAVLAAIRDLAAVDSGRAYLELAAVYEELGDEGRAREVLERAVEVLEQRPPTRHLLRAYRQLAETLKRAGRTDEAFRLLERALSLQEQAAPTAG